MSDNRPRAAIPAKRWTGPLAALVVASVLWGGAVSGTKYALAGFAPLTLLSLELAAAAAVLWVGRLARGYRAAPARGVTLPTTGPGRGGFLGGMDWALVVVRAGVGRGGGATPAAVLAVLVALAGL